MNVAISRKTDENLATAAKYEIINLTDNIVTIDVNGKLIQCGLDDPDFLFLFGVQKNDWGSWINMNAYISSNRG